MNFIFVSPMFPETYWLFCDRLKANGANVLGIGDAPYDSLRWELKNCLTEYYKVDSMENYDQMYRRVAYFAHKYGRIDWIESNNEYWLPVDARLRTDFNVNTGVKSNKIDEWNHKFNMKKYYERGGVPTARCIQVKDYDECLNFIDAVGYPVFVKPNHGMGAQDSWKISGRKEFDSFFAQRGGNDYVMEEFVTGEIYSYDAIVNSKGDILFENSAHFPPSIADLVHKNIGLDYFCLKEVPAQLQKRGRATLKAFGVKSRFVHFEFFRLTKAKKGLGKVGDFIGLEVNMRPAGGYTPDMMNFAHSTDVYKIWADMVCFDGTDIKPSDDKYFCAYSSRRDSRMYVNSHEAVMEKYGDRTVMSGRMPDAIADDMGNTFYMVKLDTEEQVKEFEKYVGEFYEN